MGILYKLTFSNGKCYIGITTESLKRRVQRHIYYARSGRNYALSAAIRKYGENGFCYDILGEFQSWIELAEQEIILIGEYNSMIPNGYNMTMGGEGTLGVKKSIEARKRIGEASSKRNLGKKLTDIHKKRVGDAFRGKSLSQETKEKMSMAAKSRKHRFEISQEHKDKISASLLGRKHSTERIEKRVAKRILNSEKK